MLFLSLLWKFPGDSSPQSSRQLLPWAMTSAFPSLGRLFSKFVCLSFWGSSLEGHFLSELYPAALINLPVPFWSLVCPLLYCPVAFVTLDIVLLIFTSCSPLMQGQRGFPILCSPRGVPGIEKDLKYWHKSYQMSHLSLIVLPFNIGRRRHYFAFLTSSLTYLKILSCAEYWIQEQKKRSVKKEEKRLVEKQTITHKAHMASKPK